MYNFNIAFYCLFEPDIWQNREMILKFLLPAQKHLEVMRGHGGFHSKLLSQDPRDMRQNVDYINYNGPIQFPGRPSPIRRVCPFDCSVARHSLPLYAMARLHRLYSDRDRLRKTVCCLCFF
jgi:hypothetical protein